MLEDKLALRPEARSAVCVAAPRVDARPGALQGSPSPTNAPCPQFPAQSQAQQRCTASSGRGRVNPCTTCREEQSVGG